EVGLPAGEIPTALFAFNVGIELGQLGFVAAILVATRAGLALAPLRLAAARWIPVYTMGSLAAFWCIERTVALVAWGRARRRVTPTRGRAAREWPRASGASRAGSIPSSGGTPARRRSAPSSRGGTPRR